MRWPLLFIPLPLAACSSLPNIPAPWEPTETQLSEPTQPAAATGWTKIGLSVRGKPARAVVEVTATSVYFQCGKSVVRSGLWLPERWPSIDGMATFAEALADQIEGVNAAAAEENLAAAYRDRLY